MALVPTLDRLTRMDVGPNADPVREMAIWQDLCENIEGAFTELVELLVVVATKNGVYVQGTAPTGAAVNDLWFDSSDGFKPYSWDGSAWQAVQDVGAAYARVGINPDGTIATDKVVNDSVLAGAVLTTPGGTTTGSTTLTSGSYTWFEVASETITAAGVPLTVSADFEIEVIDNCKFQYRLLCDGVVLGRELGPISVNTSDQPGVTITRRHTPAAGSREYTLEVSVNDANDLIVHDPLLNFTENRNV